MEPTETELAGTKAEPTGMGMEQSAVSCDPGDGIAIPVAGEGGYYMLNTEDPTLCLSDGEGEGQGQEAAYSFVPSTTTGKTHVAVAPSNRPSYENTPIFQASGGGVKTSNASPKLHPHLIIAGEGEIERVGQVGPARVQSEGRASTYENVCPPGERDIVPVPAALPVGVAKKESGRGRANPGGLYENVELMSRPGTRNPAQNHAPSNAISNRRSAQQRKDVYEVVSLGGPKANGVGGGTRSPNGSKLNIAHYASL